MDRAKGAWETYPDLDPDAQMTWAQINAKVDEILGSSPEGRRHKFPGSPEDERVKETIEILPHGARRIRIVWPE